MLVNHFFLSLQFKFPLDHAHATCFAHEELFLGLYERLIVLSTEIFLTVVKVLLPLCNLQHLCNLHVAFISMSYNFMTCMPVYLVFLQVARRICSLPRMVRNLFFEHKKLYCILLKYLLQLDCSKIFMYGKDCRLFNNIWVQT